MLIYGQGVTELKTVHSKSSKCSNCGEVGKIHFGTFSKYAHIFWIPTFPIGRQGVSECENCQQVFEYKEMPEDLKREYKIIKTDVRTPIWHFSGLVIILLIIAGAFINNKMNKDEDLRLLANPVAGDVYAYSTEDKQFSTFKLAIIEEDSISFYNNEYEINVRSGIDDINIPKNYSEDLYIMSKSDLKQMFDDGDIREIIRK